MKRFTKELTLRTALLLSASGALSASTIFDFHDQTSTSGSSSMGDTLTTTVNGLTVTESAWYVANTSSGTKFQTAALDIYNGYGLTVCSPAEGRGCDSPYHQVDNSNGVEFVLFKFSTPVSLSSVQLFDYGAIGTHGSDADMTYYTASTAITTNTTLGSLGTGTTVAKNCTGSSGTACTGTVITDTLSGTNVSYLLIGASVANTDGITDAFKLYSLTVSNVSTPEPASFGLFALALPALGLAMWRKRKSGAVNEL